MKLTRRILSLALAACLLVTCCVAGLVMPASAATVSGDLLNGIGDFEGATDLTAHTSGTAIRDIKAGALVDDPLNAGHGTVVQLSPEFNMYGKWGSLYDAAAGKWNKKMVAGKSYTLTFDAYGDAIGLYFQGRYNVTSNNAEVSQGTNGWFACGTSAGWKTYTFTFWPSDDIATTYHSDWWSWGQSWAKNGNGYGGIAGVTYVDNISIVETPAQELNIDHIGLPVGEEVQLTTSVVPARSNAGTVTWGVTGNAVIDAATGKLTVNGEGDITVTVTNGVLTDTWTTRVYRDATRVDLDLSNFYDNVAGANATVKTDADGTKYVTVNSNGATKWATMKSESFGHKEAGEWIGFSFDARTSDGTASVAAAIQVQGGITDGYTQPEFTVAATQNNGGWVNYTFYFRQKYNSDTPYVNFSVKTDNTTAKTGYDVANAYIFTPADGEMNLAGASGNMEGALPRLIANMGGSYVTTDPKDSNNKVMFIPSGKYSYSQPVYQLFYDDAGTRKDDYVKPNTMYKVTYRQIGKTRIQSGSDSYSTRLLVQGNPDTACTDWKWVTAYFLTTASPNDGYVFYLATDADSYIDDYQIYEVGNATALQPTVENTTMEVGTSQTVTINTVPKHAYPGTVTLSSGDTSVATVSGMTVKAASAKDGAVTLNATSNIEGVSGTLDMKVTFPMEHFKDGGMETDATDVKFQDTTGVTVGVEGVGMDGSRGMTITATGAKYLNAQTYKLKPNTMYRASVAMRTDIASCEVELGWVDGNWGGIQTFDKGRKAVGSEWTNYYMYFITDATPTTNGWYNFFLQVRSGTPSETTPVYCDNFSIVMLENGMDTEGALFVDGTFDNGADYRFGNKKGFITTDPADANNKVFAFDTTHKWSGSADFLGTVRKVMPYSVYKLSFDTKVSADFSGDLRIWFANKASLTLKTYNKTGAYFKKTTEWEKNEFYLLVGDSNVIEYNNFYFTCDGISAGTMYFDNLKFERMIDENTLFDVGTSVDAGFYVGGTGSRLSFAENVAGGTTIRVHISEYNNYALAPGGLVYHYYAADGTHKKMNLLNHSLNGYSESTFGTNDGQYYEFVKPEGFGYIEVTMKSATADNNVLVGTAGTSLRATAQDTYDGIRFLTRLSFYKDGSVQFVPTGDELTFKVKKDGTEYNVVEMGSILARADADATLGVAATGEMTTGKWKAIAYKKGDAKYNTMTILDYTNRDIDFAVVMKTSYTDRAYTARGYMVLDADGDVSTTDDQLVVWADTQMTDSIDSAAARLQAAGR